MEFIQTVVVFVVTLGILVTIHEWGHFYVARLCGVKVIRFSVGFGKVFYSKFDAKGTEFALAMIPLGGYVKMLDEREGEVSDSQKHYAFNNKNVYQRFAIVAAGPAVNFVFAILVYWAIFVSGVTTVIPIIGSLAENSVAEQAGLPVNSEIVAIDGVKVSSWQDVNLSLAARIGEKDSLSIRLKRDEVESDHTVSLQNWTVDLEVESPLSSFGVIPYRRVTKPIVDSLVEGGAAQRFGLEIKDEIKVVSGEIIDDWSQLVDIVKRSPSIKLDFEVIRDGALLNIPITPDEKELESGVFIGFVGMGVALPAWPEHMLNVKQENLFDALVSGLSQTWKMTVLTLDSIKKMLEGLISVKNLSGPITIAKVATANAQSGLESYLSFLAYLSISLGVLNLLPIPMLDGGHLFYYAIEMIKRKPVSQKIQEMGLRIGMVLLFSLMAIAMFNDVMRL